MGSIPACAGEPVSRPVAPPAHRVYPRVCGGTPVRELSLFRRYGLSPRVRGNHVSRRSPGRSLGSIPACAGEPSATAGCPGRWKVYPRVCGGTRPPPPCVHFIAGLSPRVRGNRPHQDEVRGAPGSIPACAGEPAAARRVSTSSRVYPRVCGGTEVGHRASGRCEGLSPRVRGNRAGPCSSNGHSGSIPACAGEPRRSGPVRRPWAVYPRVCGGTFAISFEAAPCVVYPRVCGGTGSPFNGDGEATGLSPRVRGNRGGMSQAQAKKRSIPACAGEPGAGGPDSARARVYPRVCGGTRAPGRKP